MDIQLWAKTIAKRLDELDAKYSEILDLNQRGNIQALIEGLGRLSDTTNFKSMIQLGDGAETLARGLLSSLEAK